MLKCFVCWTPVHISIDSPTLLRSHNREELDVYIRDAKLRKKNKKGSVFFMLVVV